MSINTRSLLTLLPTFVLAAALAPETFAASRVVEPGMAAVSDAKPRLDGKLNINEASQAQWELLPGIGPAMAKKLVEYRQTHKFGDPTHVMRIKGIGRKTFDAIKLFLTMEGPTTLQVVKAN
jgi:competence protein ComEA